MIVGIGCDIVDHAITDSLGWPQLPKKLQRVFTQSELELLNIESNNTKFLSGRFAAKEAVLKSIGTGIEDGFSLKEIQILKDDSGRANVKVTGKLKKLSERLRITAWHISISHTETTSIAYVIAESL
jgi:holo-[acyl-carrier protein] synthase